MSQPRSMVQVPPGVQCFVGDEARRRRAIEARVLDVFEGWDYEEIIPPLFDYADVFAGPALGPRTYTFVGRDGALLALRPDFTSLLAKVAAGRLADRALPMRLYYSGEVLRYEPPRAGRQTELYQMGLEHLGGASALSDVEVLAVAAECLDAVGISGWVLALGHVGVFHGLLEGSAVSTTAMESLRDRVEAKDPVGVREALLGADVAPACVDALVRLTTLAGDAAVLDEAARTFSPWPQARTAVLELAASVSALAAAGLGDRVAIDLGEVRGLDYYTGMVFRVYARELGFEVGGGGRYDALLGRYGRPLPAVGFMLGLDRLALVLERQQTDPADAPGAVATISAPEVADALVAARRARAEGRRVRLGRGGTS